MDVTIIVSLTYTISDEEYADSKLVLIARQPQLFFETVQAGIADVDFLMLVVMYHHYLVLHTSIHEIHQIHPAKHGDNAPIQFPQ